jgi:hypothetical protein
MEDSDDQHVLPFDQIEDDMAAMFHPPNPGATTIMQTRSQRIARNLNARLLYAKQISFRLVRTKPFQRHADISSKSASARGE